MSHTLSKYEHHTATQVFMTRAKILIKIKTPVSESNISVLPTHTLTLFSVLLIVILILTVVPRDVESN